MLDLRAPFSNSITYGKASTEGIVDIVESYCYLKGLPIERRLRFDLAVGEPSRSRSPVGETSRSRLSPVGEPSRLDSPVGETPGLDSPPVGETSRSRLSPVGEPPSLNGARTYRVVKSSQRLVVFRNVTDDTNDTAQLLKILADPRLAGVRRLDVNSDADQDALLQHADLREVHLITTADFDTGTVWEETSL